MPTSQKSESTGYSDRRCWGKGEGHLKETPRCLSICLNGLPVPETENIGEASLRKR